MFPCVLHVFSFSYSNQAAGVNLLMCSSIMLLWILTPFYEQSGAEITILITSLQPDSFTDFWRGTWHNVVYLSSIFSAAHAVVCTWLVPHYLLSDCKLIKPYHFVCYLCHVALLFLGNLAMEMQWSIMNHRCLHQNVSLWFTLSLVVDWLGSFYGFLCTFK
jgi:hypothetical protein